MIDKLESDRIVFLELRAKALEHLQKYEKAHERVDRMEKEAFRRLDGNKSLAKLQLEKDPPYIDAAGTRKWHEQNVAIYAAVAALFK